MDQDVLRKLIYYATKLDEKSITKHMNERYDATTLDSFVFDLVLPLLNLIGSKWESEEILPIHEHFLSEIIIAFIIQKKLEIKKYRDDDLSPKILLATIIPEKHSLGLRLVDLILTKNKAKTFFIGDRTPIDDIIFICEKNQIDIVAISFPATTSLNAVEANLLYLREHLSDDIYLWYGGASSIEANLRLLNCKFVQLNDMQNEILNFKTLN